MLYQRIISQTNGVSPWTCRPPGDSINDGIPLDLFSLFYVAVDHAILYIIQFGSGKTLTKIDIKSVFKVSSNNKVVINLIYKPPCSTRLQ